jgi:ribosomal protein S18 acetylase RimI-like enzyme
MLHSLLCLSILIFHSLGKLCADSRIQTTENYTEQFKIEKADLQRDLNQIVDTINLAYQRQLFNRQDYPRITVAALKELLQNRENQLYIVVSDKNEICGTVLLHGAEISLLSVHPRNQGRKLGLHLLQYAEQEAFKTYDNIS